MTTFEFMEQRAAYLRKFLRTMFGRSWREISARRLGRYDVPRWLFANATTTLGSIAPVENLVIKLKQGLGHRDYLMLSKKLPPERPTEEERQAAAGTWK